MTSRSGGASYYELIPLRQLIYHKAKNWFAFILLQTVVSSSLLSVSEQKINLELHIDYSALLRLDLTVAHVAC